MLAFEAGRKHRVRVNTISAGTLSPHSLIHVSYFCSKMFSVVVPFLPSSPQAPVFILGPLRSRAAKAIGFIDMMIDYSLANAPLQKELSAGDYFCLLIDSSFSLSYLAFSAALLWVLISSN